MWTISKIDTKEKKKKNNSIFSHFTFSNVSFLKREYMAKVEEFINQL